MNGLTEETTRETGIGQLRRMAKLTPPHYNDMFGNSRSQTFANSTLISFEDRLTEFLAISS